MIVPRSCHLGFYRLASPKFFNCNLSSAQSLFIWADVVVGLSLPIFLRASTLVERKTLAQRAGEVWIGVVLRVIAPARIILTGERGVTSRIAASKSGPRSTTITVLVRHEAIHGWILHPGRCVGWCNGIESAKCCWRWGVIVEGTSVGLSIILLTIIRVYFETARSTRC